MILPLKYRPKTFQAVVGQSTTVTVLQKSISQSRLSQLYLFHGPKGTGKTSVARIFANAVNCVSLTDIKPCRTCEICIKIFEGKYPDIIEIDAASNRGVEDMQKLKENARIVPLFGQRKVYIIDEVHQLSSTAFDSLLKIFEEPYPHILFILCTTDIQKIPPTIVSRCVRFDFFRLTLSEIIERLEYICKEEKIVINDPSLGYIGQAADGSMRDAISILDQCSIDNKVDEQIIRDVLGYIDINYVIQFCASLLTRKEKDAIIVHGQYLQAGGDSKRLIKESVKFLHLIYLGYLDSSLLDDETTKDIKQMIMENVIPIIDIETVKKTLIHLSNLKIYSWETGPIEVDVSVAQLCEKE